MYLKLPHTQSIHLGQNTNNSNQEQLTEGNVLLHDDINGLKCELKKRHLNSVTDSSTR